MSKLKVGIAGYGVIGKRRREYIDHDPYLKVVAVCDRSASSKTVNNYTEYSELLKNEELDALFVCLPNYLAPEVTIAALKKGIHVFCEKPPGRSVKDIEAVIEQEQESGKILKYGFNHRYHKSVLEAFRIVESTRLGEVISVCGVYGKSEITPSPESWRSKRSHAGGGILLDQGIHMIDLMRVFCDGFVEVESFISDTFWNNDVEDNAYVIMRDKVGRIAMLHSSATQWRHTFSLHIALTEGFLQLEGLNTSTKSYGTERLLIGLRDSSNMGTLKFETKEYLTDNSWELEVEEFAEAIVLGAPLKFGTSGEALATMKIIQEIYLSDKKWAAKHSLM